MGERTPLEAGEIEARLDEYLEVEFSFRQTSEPAQSLAELPRQEQEALLGLVQRVASSHVEMGYQFACRATRALAGMEMPMVEAWALHAMDVYDRSGLGPALAVIRDVDNFVRLNRERAAGAVLEENIGILHGFVHGLSGRKLKLEQGEEIYTDTETLYLPPMLARLADTDGNFRLYKAIVGHLWAQTRFGTFRVKLSGALAPFTDFKRALAIFHALETIRLDAAIERTLPGLYREMELLKHQLGYPSLSAAWLPAARRLRERDATAGESLQWVARLYEVPLPDSVCYQGILRPEAVEAVMAKRIERERRALRLSMRQLAEEVREGGREEGDSARRLETKKAAEASEPDSMSLEITLDGQPIVPPEEVRALMTSILQDLGEIPEEYLVPAGPGEYDPALLEEKKPDPDEVWQGTYHEEGAFLYNEWDHRRHHYRKNWCAVREKEVKPVYDDFIECTYQRYGGLVKQLRKTFEAMRDEDRLLKRQSHGDSVDIDALVEALADARHGSELSDRVFGRMHRTERNIAVVFMVDMSGSTRGWINDAERESLLLLCEALETLGDRYAIYGFSGMTRKRCELYTVKRFEEAFGAEVKGRISGIRPQDYTRMGFAIRHLTRLLGGVDARTRILITLSDGKPDDYDSYRGDYGIEDTRRALLEARRDGIHPFCITIDSEGPEYLPRMYGPAAYTVVDDVRKLPLKVADIYRKLTT